MKAGARFAGTGVPHGVIPLVIVLGFLVMLVADHLQGGSGHLRHAGRDSDDEEGLEEGLASVATGHYKATPYKSKQDLDCDCLPFSASSLCTIG